MRDLILRPAIARLARRLTGLRDDGARGAVAVLVAILIGGGVVFGMAALVVDVGQLYQNKAELQSGADAAALAVAKSCAAGTCTPAIATQYANNNASSLTGHTACVNSVSGVDGVTGGTSFSWAPALGTCAPTKNVCPKPPAGHNYVAVETSTLLPKGSTLLPPVFAGALAGGTPGTTVYACAQAEWDGPALQKTVPLTAGYCNWTEATSNGTSYASLPPYTLHQAAQPVVIVFHDPAGQEDNSPPKCQSNPPGNFGWTADPNSDCTTPISSFTAIGNNNYTYPGNSGNNTPKGCDSTDPAVPMSLPNLQKNQTVVYLPVYYSYDGKGQGTYNLTTLAPFVITGYNFGKQLQVNDRVTGQLPCGGNGKSVTCISGFFVHQIDQTTGVSIGNADLGLDIIRLTG